MHWICKCYSNVQAIKCKHSMNILYQQFEWIENNYSTFMLFNNPSSSTLQGHRMMIICHILRLKIFSRVMTPRLVSTQWKIFFCSQWFCERGNYTRNALWINYISSSCSLRGENVPQSSSWQMEFRCSSPLKNWLIVRACSESIFMDWSGGWGK